MKITDLLSKESIELNGKASSKEDVLNKMVALMEKRGNIKDAAGYKEQRGSEWESPFRMESVMQ